MLNPLSDIYYRSRACIRQWRARAYDTFLSQLPRLINGKKGDGARRVRVYRRRWRRRRGKSFSSVINLIICQAQIRNGNPVPSNSVHVGCGGGGGVDSLFSPLFPSLARTHTRTRKVRPIFLPPRRRRRSRRRYLMYIYIYIYTYTHAWLGLLRSTLVRSEKMCVYARVPVCVGGWRGMRIHGLWAGRWLCADGRWNKFWGGGRHRCHPENCVKPFIEWVEERVSLDWVREIFFGFRG